MRSYYADIFKHYFYQDLVQSRYAMHLTQPQMAKLLQMGVRSYVDLDHGKNSCSGLTLARYLIYCSPDPVAYLNGLCSVFEKNTAHIHRRSDELTAEYPVAYRHPLSVTQSAFAADKKLHPVCPRCSHALDQINQCYCQKCGQNLSWHLYGSALPRILH